MDTDVDDDVAEILEVSDSETENKDEDPYDGLWSSDEEDAEESSEVDRSESDSLVNEDMDSAKDSEEIAAQISPDDDESASRTEVLDSGCSRHLTPNKDALENYTKIGPKFLRVL